MHSIMKLVLTTVTVITSIKLTWAGDQAVATTLNAIANAAGFADGELLNDSNAETRPINQDVHFFCRDRATGKNVRVWPYDPNLSRKINRQRHTIFLIHGWVNSLQTRWIRLTLRDFANYEPNVNVCVIGWSRLASYEYQIAARRHVYNVGEFIVNTFRKWNLRPGAITLIGHSLGAQIAGHVGYLFGGRIARIYALDPAGILFCTPITVGLNRRLDKSDARYVQVILTTSGIIGCSVNSGHQTFFPQGGTSPQPACPLENAIDCSHGIGEEYFRLSIRKSIRYRARRCQSWLLYRLGFCNRNDEDFLGYRSKRLHGNFYLRVGRQHPYTV